MDQHFEDLRYVSDFQQLHSHDRNVIRGSSVLDYYFATKLTFKPFVHVTRSTFSISVIDTITSLGGSVSFYLVYVSSANGKNDTAQSFVVILCALGKIFVALGA